MKYSKQNFRSGQKLTAEHLNNMENGIVNNYPYSGFEGKSVSFLADSITTFADADGTRWLPDKYLCWYSAGNAVDKDGGNNHATSGIDEVNKTWWKQVLNTLGMKLCVNASWSGSKVTGNSTDTTGSVGCGNGRIDALTVKDGVKSECAVGTTPDIIIIFIGINDFGYGDNPAGSWNMTSLPEEGNQTEFDKAYALCVKKVMAAYPNAEVFCCTLLETPSSYDDNAGWPVNSKGGATLNDYNNKIRDIAHLFGANIIDLHACGMTYFNCVNYCVDNLHPNVQGAQLLARKAISDICAQSIYSHSI